MVGPPDSGSVESAAERIAKQMAESGIASGAAKTYDNFAKKLAESGVASEAAKTHERIAKELAGLGIDDDLRTAFGRTADLTSSLGDSLAYLRASSLPGLEFAAAKMPDLTVPRNPIFDTNEELAELSRTTRDLVGMYPSEELQG